VLGPLFPNLKLIEILQTLFLTVFPYGLIEWLYVVAIQITHSR
jgi:hypothetical protein